MRCPLTSLRYISATESGVPSCVSKHCRAMYLPVAGLPNFTLCHPFPDAHSAGSNGNDRIEIGPVAYIIVFVSLDKGIVQRLARVLSNVWQSFFQRLTKFFSTFDKSIIQRLTKVLSNV